MTTDRFFGGAAQGSGNAFTGSFISGLVFTALSPGGAWLYGYSYWCPPAPSPGPTVPQKFALWNITSGAPAGTLVPDSVVTSGDLTVGAWNDVMLPSPVPLAVGGQYLAATGVNGNFTQDKNLFASGDPFAAGITAGPVFAYSDTTGSAPAQFGLPQGVFTTTGSDPSVTIPSTGSSSASFGVDVIVGGPPPSNTSWQLWPNLFGTNANTSADTALNYILATEIDVAAGWATKATAIRYYSPSGTAQLATRAAIWSIATGTELAVISSPSWSGAAGSGWVQADFAEPVALPPGSYRVSVYNSAAVPDQWSATDISSGYWSAGAGASGIVAGPLTAPKFSAAQLAWQYNAADGGASPPYSDGTRVNGQSVFGLVPGGANTFPQLQAAGSGGALSQNYWVDLVVTASPLGGGGVPFDAITDWILEDQWAL